MNDILTQIDINYLLVLLEGFLSFFSPCILPLIPLYIGYLSGNAKDTNEDGTIVYHQKKVFLNTLFFVLGITTTFLLLGFSFSALGSYIEGNQIWITRIGGVLIIILGLIQLNVFKFNFMNKEYRFKLHRKFDKMNFLLAYTMGFVFSFSWTPCVGPMLSSVLIMAGNSGSALLGTILVLLYAIGFVFPFLLLGIFTTSILNLLKKYQKIMTMSIKIGGIILILIGGRMVLDTMQFKESPSQVPSNSQQEEIPAPDITWHDADNKEYRIQDDKGKEIMILFWAEWCGYCKSELPTIQELYESYGKNKKDFVLITVVQPDENDTKESYLEFMKENDYTFPILFDDGSGFAQYGIKSFPTTYMINADGTVYGYAQGAMGKDRLIEVIEEVKNNKK